MTMRAANLILGTWLTLSAFLWDHGPAQFYNAVIAGVVAATLALLASETMPRARHGNTIVGGWMLASSILLPETSRATAWNHVVVGLGIGLFSLVAQLPGADHLRSRLTRLAVRVRRAFTERTINGTLGIWLVCSAFLWEHSIQQFQTAWIIGAGVALSAILGEGRRSKDPSAGGKIRLIHGFLGTLLVALTLLWPAMRGGTFLNHMLTGMTIVLVSLKPSLAMARRDANLAG